MKTRVQRIIRLPIWCGTERRKAKHYTAKRFIDFDGGQYILYVKQRGVFSLDFLQDKIDMNVNRKKGSASPFPLWFSSGRSFVSSGSAYQWINEKFVCVFLICFYLFCVLCTDGIFLFFLWFSPTLTASVGGLFFYIMSLCRSVFTFEAIFLCNLICFAKFFFRIDLNDRVSEIL